MSRKPKRRNQSLDNDVENKKIEKIKLSNKSQAENAFLSIVFCICLIVAIYSGKEIIKWFINNKENADIIKSVSSKVSVEKLENEMEKYNIDFAGLKEINEDTVGWLKVYRTDVEFPVVQTNNNNYYLTHNFEKKTNAAGWAFMDYRNKLDGTDKNIVIYGHNRRDGSMFASLRNILENEWYTNDDNRVIIFVTENEYSLYEVFSVYEILEEDYYISTNFDTISYSDYLKRAVSKSIYDFGIDVNEDDSILTLSTCANNSRYRIVLQAKKMNLNINEDANKME